MSNVMLSNKPHLVLKVGQDSKGHSRAMRTYATYPFRLSPPLSLSPQNQECLYLYLMNTAPGWFAGDCCRSEITLASNTHLFLTDQAATKVHTMPEPNQLAQLHYQVNIGEGAFLEWLPEPIILYKNACFQQTYHITIAEKAGFAISEILIPGRLASGEYYQFRNYSNQVIVRGSRHQLIFKDSGQISGKNNSLMHSKLIAALPIVGTLYLLPPKSIPLSLLRNKLQQLVKDYGKELRVGISALPNCEGLLIRSLATNASCIRHYTNQAVTFLRIFLDLPTLPEVPK